MKSHPKAVALPPCGDPKALLALAVLLGPGILSSADHTSLGKQLPDPAAGRVRLGDHVMLSLLSWLHELRWTGPLQSEPQFRAATAAVLQRLAMWMAALGKAELVITMSLVARYLIAMAHRPVDVLDRNQVEAAYDIGLPAYWSAPGQPPSPKTDKVDRQRFVANYDRFYRVIAGGKRRKGTGLARTRTALDERLARKGCRVPSRRQLRRSQRPLTETELGADAPRVDRGGGVAHAGLTVFAGQIALDVKPLATAIKVVAKLRHYPIGKISLRECATIAVSGASLFCGIPAHAALQIALHCPAQKGSPAAFHAGRGCVSNFLAQGSHDALKARIPAQNVHIPIPAYVREAMARLCAAGLETIGNAFPGKVLPDYFDSVLDLMGWKDADRPLLRRLHVGWQYVAHHLTGMNPGVIQLLTGNLFAAYRSETSYLTVTERYLWQCAYRVHDRIYQLLGMPECVSRPEGDPGTRVGKLAPTLAELAAAGQAILAEENGSASAAACATWIMQVHGRRPTTDQPHPGGYVLHGDGPALLVADKNLGGGRRLRLVPASTAGIEAATASRPA